MSLNVYVKFRGGPMLNIVFGRNKGKPGGAEG